MRKSHLQNRRTILTVVSFAKLVGMKENQNEVLNCYLLKSNTNGQK